MSSVAVFSFSLLRGFSGVSLLKRQLECVVFLSDDTVTVACVIWVSCKYLTVLLRGLGSDVFQQETIQKRLKQIAFFVQWKFLGPSN